MNLSWRKIYTEKESGRGEGVGDKGENEQTFFCPFREGRRENGVCLPFLSPPEKDDSKFPSIFPPLASPPSP